MSLTKTIKSSLKKVSPFKKVVVGMSGGADSTVLMHILIKLGYEVIIAHLNHSLRGEASDGDEKFVKDLGKKLNIPYVTKKSFIPKEGNLENNARNIRYDFLESVRKKYKADVIATGHHLDDQVETFLMHMVRGSGLRGQIGIKYHKEKIIRPMLDIKRSEILSYAKENDIKYRTDESNNDLSYDRNFWRHLVIPYLKKENTNLYEKVQDINETAHTRLKNVSDKAKKWVDKYFVGNSFERGELNRLPDHVKAEIFIQILGAKDLYGKTINRLIDFVKFGTSGKKVEVKGKTFQLQHTSVLVHEGMTTPTLPKSKITLTGIKWGKITIKSKYGKPLYVRQWQEGDKFQPKGMKGTKSVQNFFVDKKIPKSKRHEIPIIVDENDDIMAVADMRVANKAGDLKKDITIST
ncbi:tRNA lysidine(34) synthetase TilS [Patescibacteria group bacterium]|nr:tRNA lysidine(34) synthetase TilS [Patescibacteria group bacterium]